MKWAFFFRSRFAAAALLAATFLVVVIKNIIDTRNVSQLRSSFASVYEDRLLPESYIYRLSEHLWQKKMLIDNCKTAEDFNAITAEISAHNTDMHHLLVDYGRTRLTLNEDAFFTSLKKVLCQIEESEQALGDVTKFAWQLAARRDAYDQQFAQASHVLHHLSGIQIQVAKELDDHSKKIVAGSSILSHLEVGLLIGVGLIIQALLFASKSVIPKQQQRASLN